MPLLSDYLKEPHDALRDAAQTMYRTCPECRQSFQAALLCRREERPDESMGARSDWFIAISYTAACERHAPFLRAIAEPEYAEWVRTCIFDLTVQHELLRVAYDARIHNTTDDITISSSAYAAWSTKEFEQELDRLKRSVVYYQDQLQRMDRIEDV